MDTDNPTQALLKTAAAIGQRHFNVNGAPKMQTYFMAQFRLAVERGADIHARDDQGKDAMDWLANEYKNPTGVCVSVAKALIDQGYKILDTKALEAIEGPLRDKIVEHLARKERDGVLIRRENGQNLLHAVAICPLDVLQLAVCANPIFNWNDSDKSSRKWLNDVDNEGRTPLHIMWQTRTQPFEPQDQHWIWDMTMLLEKYGADIMVRDNSGTSVLDLIEQALDKKMVEIAGPIIEATSLPYIAQIEQRIIERATPGAVGVARSPRL